MKSIALLLATAGVLSLTSVATATDWTGFSVGVQAGIVNMSGHEDYDPDYDTPYDGYEDWTGTGGSLGVFAAYDIDVTDMFVLGVGGEINWNNVSALEWPEYPEYDDQVHYTWDAGIFARAGVKISPQVLLYGLLGYSWGGFDLSEYWVDEEGYSPDDIDDSTSGVKVGFGGEALVTDDMFVKGEVAATFYRGLHVMDGGTPYWMSTPTVYSAKIGVGWKF